MDLRTDDFDYDLPEELIADRPLENREESRMLVLDRKAMTIEHRMFKDFKSFLQPDDLVVLNNTKVIPARVFSNDGAIELVVTDRTHPKEWVCMVRPGKKMKPGREVCVGESVGTVVEILEDGNRVIRWDKEVDLDSHGELALPHYMGRESDQEDRDRYQTVFAEKEGAIAAPTAGLHFSPQTLEEISHSFLTLHVGIGTFRPVKADFIKDHEMHAERYELTQETAEKINQASRTIAVGTTCSRVLESLGREHRTLSAASGVTDIFIHPPYDFKVVDGLLTNFHLPKSTLIMLISAFAGKEFVMEAYRQAVEEKYRFFSYGDCMLIL